MLDTTIVIVLGYHSHSLQMQLINMCSNQDYQIVILRPLSLS
jgi:hypothetical protein